jgi:CAAX prenyl protease-like protein
MPPELERLGWKERYPSLTYVAPFGLLLLAVYTAAHATWSAAWQAALVSLLLGAAVWICCPEDLECKLVDASGSALLGVAVFLLWIAPEILVPGYRSLAVFHNSFVGHMQSSLSPHSVGSPWVLFWRSLRAVLLAPIIEEMFWRAWLPRWLIATDFRSRRLGSFTPPVFWTVAILFAVEHGPYWDVGLIAGIVYNWWMARTKSIADCIWMHAVTNTCLSVYVIATGAWTYWQ